MRHPRGENTISKLFDSPLIIPRVPVTFAKVGCGRVLAKDFTSLQELDYWLHGKITSRQSGG